jgi:hypothetical protein
MSRRFSISTGDDVEELTRRSFVKMAVLSAFCMGRFDRVMAAVAGAESDDATFIRRAGLTFRSRSDWTSEPSRADRLRRMVAYDRLTMHHSGGDQFHDRSEMAAVQRLQGMLAEHASRGYGDIGYHFVLDPAGRVWEGRRLAFEGAHAVGQNEANIGVVVLGDYDRQDLVQVQRESLRILIGCIRERFGIKLHRVYGHSDLGQTACPGRSLYAWVSNLKGS